MRSHLFDWTVHTRWLWLFKARPTSHQCRLWYAICVCFGLF